MIELGRYQIDHVPRENKLCPLRKFKQIEDGNHFLLSQEYSSLRKVFLHQISEIVPDIDRKPTTEIIKFLMNSNNYSINKLDKKYNQVHFLVYEYM